MGEVTKSGIAKKRNIVHLRARDQMRFVACNILDSWDEIKRESSPESRHLGYVGGLLVDDLVATCIRFGLFEEAQRAAAFRITSGLRVAEVDEVLTICLERFMPYHAFSRYALPATGDGARDGFYFREMIRSYPPFAELLQATSDKFRAKVAKEWL